MDFFKYQNLELKNVVVKTVNIIDFPKIVQSIKKRKGVEIVHGLGSVWGRREKKWDIFQGVEFWYIKSASCTTCWWGMLVEKNIYKTEKKILLQEKAEVLPREAPNGVTMEQEKMREREREMWVSKRKKVVFFYTQFSTAPFYWSRPPSRISVLWNEIVFLLLGTAAAAPPLLRLFLWSQSFYDFFLFNGG